MSSAKSEDSIKINATVMANELKKKHGASLAQSVIKAFCEKTSAGKLADVPDANLAKMTEFIVTLMRVDSPAATKLVAERLNAPITPPTEGDSNGT